MKPHLSATQLDMFCRCPEAWRRRYIEKEIIPPRASMLRGSSIHVAAENNFRQKIESHQDLPIPEIVDCAVASYETKLKHDGYELQKGETHEDVKRGVDVVAAMAEAHGKTQSPDYQPIAVEDRFMIELPGDHDIVGVIDMITDDHQVIDLKTGKRPQSQADADTSTQLTIYAAAMHQRGASDLVTVKLDCLTEPTARSPVKRSVIASERSRSDLPVLAERVAVVSQTIQAGLFAPAAPGSWNCSEQWCGYWSTCKYVNSERIKASQQTDLALKVLHQIEAKGKQ